MNLTTKQWTYALISILLTTALLSAYSCLQLLH